MTPQEQKEMEIDLAYIDELNQYEQDMVAYEFNDGRITRPPRKGERFVHKTRDTCEFVGTFGDDRYQLRHKSGAVLTVWKTELVKYWRMAKPVHPKKQIKARF
jgi:hypothetical protein